MIQCPVLKRQWLYEMEKNKTSINQQEWDLDTQGNRRTNDTNHTVMQNLLDKTGPGFCIAKWNQVTMHLGTGMTHSCHHPSTHKIPLEELKNNPTALHNTKFKKEQRKTMLDGKRPSECDYCWRMEDSGNISDRPSKSMEHWAINSYDDIVKLKGDEDVIPTYLEVSFSNVCNMKCLYCGPDASSKWYEEIKQNGAIKLLEGTSEEYWAQGWQKDLEVFKKRDVNPYVDAFWEWWPELYKKLKVFRITGGEPLMSKDTFKVLEWFLEHPNPDLELSINSNLSVPDALWDKFMSYVEKLKDSDNIKNITIYTSVEGWGKRAEYTRTGLDFEKFKTRYEQLVAMPNVRSVIMCTFNILSITSIHMLFEWHLGLREKYNFNPAADLAGRDYVDDVNKNGFKSELLVENTNWKHGDQVSAAIDIPYLRHPTFLDAKFCTTDMVNKFLLPTYEYMITNQSKLPWTMNKGFEEFEIAKLRRIMFSRMHFNPANSDKKRKDVDLARSQFYEFINEMDKRNKTDFLSTFPEMEDFYYECKESLKRLHLGEHGDIRG